MKIKLVKLVKGNSILYVSLSQVDAYGRIISISGNPPVAWLVMGGTGPSSSQTYEDKADAYSAFCFRIGDKVADGYTATSI